MVAETKTAVAPTGAAEAKAELLRLFGVMGGVTARAEEYVRLLSRFDAPCVAEALEALVEEGSVELASLSDGGSVYHFIRP
jgi:hypothetical protein